MSIFLVFSGRTGKFRLADEGVKGEGTYTLNNQTADINLHLIIGNILRAPVVQAMNVPMLKPATIKDTANRTKSVKVLNKVSADRQNQTKVENAEHQVEHQVKKPTMMTKQERLSDKGIISNLPW